MSDRLDCAREAGGKNAAPRILIVEDDALIAWDMGLTLEAAGFEVCGTAYSSAAALDQAATCRPDVVLIDANLNEDMDGVETARLLRIRGLRTPIIFVTGYGDPDTSRRIRALNPDGYLLKPVMPEDLKAAIHCALKAHCDRSE